MVRGNRAKSAYFFRLENIISKNNSIHQININSVIADNAKLISKVVTSIVTYSSKYNEEATSLFLNSIKDMKSIGIID